ncbi:MAG: hypothetical protein Edafosvirus12_16 [Edafosvirus sp.]|uniref:Uncharacterized protein n=1 Tax=Edafosvirus sp. TaxID=2487765 RepID=A0A3G4ZU53_9VIRU|nr:MAG: hypothetical protein Edafosvirus12_16 [Edafosvirus sp.]
MPSKKDKQDKPGKKDKDAGKDKDNKKKNKDEEENDKEKDKDAGKKEKGDKPNQATADANLDFDVMAFRKWMKTHFSSNECSVVSSSKDKEGNTEKKKVLPKFNGSHIALAAVNESLCHYVLTLVKSRIQKDKSGLYNITRPAIRDAILLSDDLVGFYSVLLTKKFDKKMTYSYCVSRERMNTYIEKHFGENVKLTVRAYNYLAFVLLKASIAIVDTAYVLIKYANRKSVDPNSVMCSVNIVFSEGATVAHHLHIKASDAVKSSGRKLAVEDNDDNEDNDADEEEDTKKGENPKKENAGKKDDKKNKGKKVDLSDDDEEDEEEDDKNKKDEKDSEDEVSDDEDTKKNNKKSQKA